jgi:hypothetical protein
MGRTAVRCGWTCREVGAASVLLAGLPARAVVDAPQRRPAPDEGQPHHHAALVQAEILPAVCNRRSQRLFDEAGSALLEDAELRLRLAHAQAADELRHHVQLVVAHGDSCAVRPGHGQSTGMESVRASSTGLVHEPPPSGKQ